jgi:hypothetical protein
VIPQAGITALDIAIDATAACDDQFFAIVLAVVGVQGLGHTHTHTHTATRPHGHTATRPHGHTHSLLDMQREMRTHTLSLSPIL